MDLNQTVARMRPVVVDHVLVSAAGAPRSHSIPDIRRPQRQSCVIGPVTSNA
jgi:hypothetical protein